MRNEHFIVARAVTALFLGTIPRSSAPHSERPFERELPWQRSGREADQLPQTLSGLGRGDGLKKKAPNTGKGTQDRQFSTLGVERNSLCDLVRPGRAAYSKLGSSKCASQELASAV